jgi:Mg-chelatase subunit ChlD
VVYVLDCSGSMGAGGKFDAARAALISTLKQQPTSVRFQVIVYAGTAAPLLASSGNALPATDANVRAATEKLAALDARGKSNHLEAVRAALAFRPDVILLLTDADDLNVAALRSIVASAPKSVLGCVGQVTAGGVQRPRELK